MAKNCYSHANVTLLLPDIKLMNNTQGCWRGCDLHSTPHTTFRMSHDASRGHVIYAIPYEYMIWAFICRKLLQREAYLGIHVYPRTLSRECFIFVHRPSTRFNTLSVIILHARHSNSYSLESAFPSSEPTFPNSRFNSSSLQMCSILHFTLSYSAILSSLQLFFRSPSILLHALNVYQSLFRWRIFGEG
jgi:hypothetical protein